LLEIFQDPTILYSSGKNTPRRSEPKVSNSESNNVPEVDDGTTQLDGATQFVQVVTLKIDEEKQTVEVAKPNEEE